MLNHCLAVGSCQVLRDTEISLIKDSAITYMIICTSPSALFILQATIAMLGNWERGYHLPTYPGIESTARN